MKARIVFPEESGLNPVELELNFLPDVFTLDNSERQAEPGYTYNQRYWKVSKTNMVVQTYTKNAEHKAQQYKEHLKEEVIKLRKLYPHLDMDTDILNLIDTDFVKPTTWMEIYVVPTEYMP